MIISLVIRLLRLVVNQAAKNQEVEPLEPALYTRKARSAEHYIKVGADAMINDGKNLEEVKVILLNRGLYKDYIDLIAGKAQDQYKNWLATNGNTPPLGVVQLYEKLAKETSASDSSIKITTETEEDHSRQFCALIGFKRYYELSGRDVLYKLTNNILFGKPVMEYGDSAIWESTFARLGGNVQAPYLRVVTVNGQRETVFPYLKTKLEIPFQTEQIIEWDHDDKIEAEISGVWNSTFPLCFFATDYAVNKHIYKSEPGRNVRLSAFILNLIQSDNQIDKDDTTQDITGYWPAPKYEHESYYSFEGLILSLMSANVDNLTPACVLTLKLIDKKRGKELITDAYVTASNIKAKMIEPGMLVKGTLWFQGELA